MIELSKNAIFGIQYLCWISQKCNICVESLIDFLEGIYKGVFSFFLKSVHENTRTLDVFTLKLSNFFALSSILQT